MASSATPFSEEVFDITDFTTASDWERFVAQIEEVIRQWKLNTQQTTSTTIKRPQLTRYHIANGQWKEQKETLRFGRVEFSLIHHKLVIDKEPLGVPIVIKKFGDDEEARQRSGSGDADDWSPMLHQLMNADTDFPARIHCIGRWFGCCEFLVISPIGESIATEDRAKLLLSSASIASFNTQCAIPVFIQLHQRQRRLYHGIAESGTGIRTHFDMIHFRDVPGPYRYLSELLFLFQEKIQCPISNPPPVLISIRFTHLLREWPHEWLHQRVYDNENDNDDSETLENEDHDSQADDFQWLTTTASSSFSRLPLKCLEEPIVEVQLSTVWSSLSEEVIVDSEVHSDLDPFLAPLWTLRILQRETTRCTLSDSLTTLQNLTTSWAASCQILGKLIADSDANDAEIEIKHALDKLANPHPIEVTLPKFISKLRVRKNQVAWIQDQFISFIFTDEKEEKENVASGETSSSAIEIDSSLRQLKSCPRDCLTWRIALTLCLASSYSAANDFGPFAHLWKEIVSELRQHWELGKLLPRLEDGNPDLGSCLLNQKLQMLRCCIAQKLKRESRQQSDGTKRESSPGDNEDEFFDCVEDQNDQTDAQQVQEEAKPEGRLSQCGNLMLINEKEPLYIPITQEAAPMTEDMLQEHARILSQLGTTEEGSALRARMQSASLISDMEAFKAANPGAVIEDFVRWHSPRDWIEEEEGSGKGELSARMQITGNMWIECWENARPVPVHRQKRLFDYTKEAEKVLHYLTSLTVSELVELVLPVVINCALEQIIEKRREVGLQDHEFPLNISEVIRATNLNNYPAALQIIRENEMHIHMFHSLVRKFQLAHELEFGCDSKPPIDLNELRLFALKLIREPEQDLPKAGNGYFGKLVKRMFEESQIAIYEASTAIGERSGQQEGGSGSGGVHPIPKIPAPIAKEFIFRTSVPRPANYSRISPQRLYCVLANGEFRLAGAFSQDTTFF